MKKILYFYTEDENHEPRKPAQLNLENCRYFSLRQTIAIVSLDAQNLDVRLTGSGLTVVGDLLVETEMS